MLLTTTVRTSHVPWPYQTISDISNSAAKRLVVLSSVNTALVQSSSTAMIDHGQHCYARLVE